MGDEIFMNEKVIIAIGASAGGLKPLYEFFDNTLPDGVSYVITTHLYPHQKSMLTELIRKHSSLKVSEVTDNMEIETNNVYVMPENKVMSIKDGYLMLDDRDLSIKINMAIDIFFKSLSEETKFKKVAIILSGMGTDGTKGISELINAGCYVMVQDPENSDQDSMPNSVIKAGYANVILHPKEMPKAIKDLVEAFD
jgi:two-component system CheB/CheR fusion protein